MVSALKRRMGHDGKITRENNLAETPQPGIQPKELVATALCRRVARAPRLSEATTV